MVLLSAALNNTAVFTAYLQLHTGALFIKNHVLLCPGRSGTGKSSLVHALVQQGSVYYSDEYALVTHEGCVAPVLKPIMLRNQEGTQQFPFDVHPSQHGTHTAPVGTLLFTHYAPHAVFNPVELSSAQAFQSLLDNCINLRDMPQQGLTSLKNMLTHARVFSSLRGDVSTCAHSIYTWVASMHEAC
jgi:hypothetical protein